MPWTTEETAAIESMAREGRTVGDARARFTDKTAEAVDQKFRRAKGKVGATPATFTPPPSLPAPVPEAGGPTLPDPVAMDWQPFLIDTPGHHAILSDVHMPYHDKPTVEAWAKEARHRNASVLLINGDLLDCGEISTHYRAPNEARLELEIECGTAFFAWLRGAFPKARIVFKEGNHEARLPRYLANNAPALFGLKGLTLASLLGLDSLGVEWVGDGRTIKSGKLPVVHGHEFGGGGGGVNPARWLFLRAASTAICGHYHRTSEHHERALDERLHGVWSVGCACYMHPAYHRNNKWNHGFAFSEVSQDGSFRVTNRRRLPSGEIV